MFYLQEHPDAGGGLELYRQKAFFLGLNIVRITLPIDTPERQGSKAPHLYGTGSVATLNVNSVLKVDTALAKVAACRL